MRAVLIHRRIGIVLLLPFLGWVFTGLVFFLKPGYARAYEVLAPRTYPLASRSTVTFEPDWREVRYLRTKLGDHVLVKTDSGWQQLDPATKQPRSFPNESELRTLLTDAFSVDPSRYGNVTAIHGPIVTTDTGVEVTVDWNSLTFQQRGRDTERIDLLYRIHYLQWTGIRELDRVLGFTGLALVLTLTTLGAWLAFKHLLLRG
jgi:hypothetical protein